MTMGSNHNVSDVYRWNSDVRRRSRLGASAMFGSHGTASCDRCPIWGSTYLRPNANRENQAKTGDRQTK